MPWTGFPISGRVSDQDAHDYQFLIQLYKATQERHLSLGSPAWPEPSFIWYTGTVTGLTNNGNGTYTLTDSNQRFHVPLPTDTTKFFPTAYDVVIDDPLDGDRPVGTAETQVVHAQIQGNTATTLIINDVFEDLLTGGFLTSTNLINQTYWVIRRGGIFWPERWPAWPNDHESYLGLHLVSGANQPVTSLTSAADLTATVSCPNHQFITGDMVKISGAVSINSRYNGTFSITVTDSNTFTYILGGGDSSPATGNITAWNQYVGASDIQGTTDSGPTKYPLNSAGGGLYNTGYELCVQGVALGGSHPGSKLRRITLTGNDTQNLYFIRQAGNLTVSGQYAVGRAGFRYRFYNQILHDASYQGWNTGIWGCDHNPEAGSPYRWYHSAWDYLYSRYPDGTIQATPSPRQAMTLQNADGSSRIVSVYDQDVWTPYDDQHNPPDKNYTPDARRSLRGLQVDWMFLCSNFVAPDSYQGIQIIPTNFTVATWLNYAGINGYISTAGAVDPDQLGITIDDPGLPYYPIDVFYTIRNDDNSISGGGNSYGQGCCDKPGHLAIGPCNSPPNDSHYIFGLNGSGTFNPLVDSGKSVVLSLGFTRDYPNEFVSKYPSMAFIPDFDSTSKQYIVIPSPDFPGTWWKREPSTKYREKDYKGTVSDSNGYREFVDGDFARYVGDNWNDPTIHILNAPGGPVGVPVGNPDNYPYTYWDNLYEGKPPPATRLLLEAQKTGSVTGTGDTIAGIGGTSFQLQDTTKNWYVPPGITPVSAGILLTESGVFDSGDSTSGGDSSKLHNGLWSGSHYLTWIVQISNDGGVTFPYRRYVYKYLGDAVLHWNEALPFGAAGKHYRIQYPRSGLYGRWQSREVIITFPDSTMATVTITQSDDNTLYFPAAALSGTNYPTGVPVGSSYEIHEDYPGGVYEWSAEKVQWVVPSGLDPRTGGVAWRTDQTGNEPTYNTRYGLTLKDDYVTPTIINQMQSAINVLSNFVRPFDWGGGEQSVGQQDNPQINLSDAESQAQGHFNDNWRPAGGFPFAFADSNNNCACYNYAIGRRYARGFISSLGSYGHRPVQASIIDFYSYSMVPTGDLTNPIGTTTSTGCSVWEFDSEGDSVTYGPDSGFNLFSSVGPSDNDSRESDLVGSMSQPGAVDPGSSCCPGAGNSITDGYVVTRWFAIIKYNCAGGYSFQ